MNLNTEQLLQFFSVLLDKQGTLSIVCESTIAQEYLNRIDTDLCVMRGYLGDYYLTFPGVSYSIRVWPNHGEPTTFIQYFHPDSTPSDEHIDIPKTLQMRQYLENIS